MRLYRDPQALKAATAGLEGKPLLIEHRPVTADAHPRQSVVGTVTNPTFENGEVFGDLIVWDADGIRAIERKELPALSLGYRYRLDPTPGRTPEGEEFDGRMLDIAMNHCSLVENPRVPGAIVADAAPGFSGIGLKSIGEKHMKQIRKAFGLDAPCRTKDEDLRREDGPKAAEDDGELAAELMQLLKSELSPEHLERVGAILAKLGDAEEGEERGASVRERYDDFEPEGDEESAGLSKAEREDTSGPMKPNGLERSRHLSKDAKTGPAANLRRVARALAGKAGPAGAMDAAARVAFDQRYPQAKRIDASGDAFCFVNGGPQYRESPHFAEEVAGASKVPFHDRFPGAARIR